jgi:hypoxanthine phosphoribosyltransferase
LPIRRFIDADAQLLDSFALAVKVHESGFRPDFIVGLWRGGTAVGIAVQEALEQLGAPADHIAVRTSYAGPAAYAKRSTGKGAVQVHGLRYLLERVEERHSLLIVDDVLSTGRSVKAVIDKLARRARRNTPHDIRSAVVWYRPQPTTVRPPDYLIHETDDWLVLPYELADLAPEEIAERKPVAAAVIEEVERQRAASKAAG